jgi:hypothetical protein
MKRLRLGNNTHFVEFPDNCSGLMQIKAFRKSHPEFKGKRIKPGLQLLPSKVSVGEIYEYQWK